MANPPIPPLFCSTPPPIEETAASSQNDEDFCDYSNDNISDYIENDVNDEFNDFSISVPVYFEGNNNIKTVLPDLFANSTSRSIPPNDINCDTTLLTHSENVGADNNEQQNSTANLLSSETKSLNKVDNIKLNDDGHVDDRNEKNFNNFQFGGINEVNKDDSGRSSQSERLFQDVNEIVENPKITEPLNDVVVLEDVPDDDSDDERLSRRNRNNFLHCTEDSEDFFALQPVDVKNHIDNVIDEINTIDLELKTESINTFETVANDELTPHKKVPCRKEIHESENHDPENESSTIVNQSNADNDKSDDEFANFQDFCTSNNTESGWKASFESPTVGFTKSNNEKPESYDNDSIELGNELDNTYEDDDDFGEFSEAPTPLMPIQSKFSNTSTTQSAPTTPSVPQYIETHLKSMLDVMFPKITPSISSNNVDTLEQYQSTNNFLKLAFVESAKALEYQWINSNMRHSLIKSLGIDSRNIFLTEKWNSSMPRFAANLSFDPLQPLKPTSVPLQPEKLSSSNQKTAVPVADVDWQSSGLVNPLDGSKAEMATQSADAYNTESCASSVLVDNEADSSEHTCNDNHDTNNASSTNATTETPTIAATTTSAALSSTATRSGHIDARSTNNNKNEDKSDVVDDFVSENNDVGHFDCSNGEIQSESIKELETADDKAYEEGINSPAFEEQEISSTSTQETETKNPSDMHYESVSISRSTFAGPLKETHIFTPSIPDQLDEEMRALPATSIAFPITTTNAATPGTTQKVFPIDFDYEKAAAGIIIDETVVRKEYRDIEYNPGFSLAVETQETTLKTRESINTPPSLNLPSDEFDDEFTDFQSVPPPPQQQQALAQSPTVMRSKPLGLPSATNAAAPTSSGMILSPAILLPQAISIKSKQPKIEWGDSAANIDPDELARIEELFPQQGKNSSRSDSRKSTPTRQAVSTNSLSISASIASQQQQQQLQKNSVDEDDWSEFVSVPIPATETAASTTPSNALNAVQQQSPYRNQVKRNFSTTNNDDEWSDFVSSAPSVPQNVRASPASFGLPQFNSASWQNANFYNNPLSIYHRNYVNTVPNATPTKLKQQQNNNYSSYNNNQNNNNDNNNIDISNNRKQNHVGSNSNNNNFQQQHKYQQQDQYLSNEPQKSTSATAKQLQQQQQIQIMQDFSTSPAVAIPLSYRSHMTSGQSINYAATTAFQVGSAKVAPTVSLIPDLGFVAPAMPVHTAIINALPKPSATTPPPRRK